MLWTIIGAMVAAALTPAPSPESALACPQATDGNTIARVQSASESLIERLRPNPYYGGAWFEYRPCYRVVFALTNDDLRPAVTAAAPEHLRPYIGFAGTSLSQSERDAASLAIRQALGAGRIVAVFIEGGPREPFRIGVRTEADAAIARSLIPERYRAITVVMPGGYAEPIPEAAREQLDPPPAAPGEYVGPTAADRARHLQDGRLEPAELQLYVIPLSRNVRPLSGFSDLYIEHEPSWHVVVAFTDPPPREAVIRLAPAEIRDRIVIRRAKRTQAEINAELEALAAAFRSGGFDFAGGYDVKAQRFGFTVATAADRKRAVALIPPRLRADVDVSVGPLPVPE